MDVTLVEKQSFTVIGKLGQGFANEGIEWIPPLWQDANRNFDEIRELAKLDETGSLVGFWGAMSDVDETFERWNDQGKYLAGCEVVDNAVPPSNWTKWVIPSYRNAVVKCTQSTYGDIFNYMIQEYLPRHEFYDPKETNGELELYFPIQK